MKHRRATTKGHEAGETGGKIGANHTVVIKGLVFPFL